MSLLRTVKGRDGYQLRFYVAKKRWEVWVGKPNARGRRAYEREVQSLVDCCKAGVAPEPTSVQWAEGLPERIHAKLLESGLIPPRKTKQLTPEQRRLDNYSQDFIDSLSIADRTKKNFKQTRDWMLQHLGTPDIGSVTRQDMRRWQQFMKSKGLARSTRNKHVQRGKAIFQSAVDDRILVESPADAIKEEPPKAAEARKGDGLVTPETTQRVLAGLPDTNWKLIFGFMRFQGMRRCETHAIQWSHVRWDEGMLDIHSPKTGYRECPIFPDLLPILQDAFEIAPPNTERCINIEGDADSITPLLLKRVERILGKGNAWPKICQQLRVTRRNELERQFPNHTVNKWLGHDRKTADEYYLTVTDGDLQRAANLDRICVPTGYPEPHSTVSHAVKTHDTKPMKSLCASVSAPVSVPRKGFEPLLPD